MQYSIGIDCGVRYIAISLFNEENELCECDLVKTSKSKFATQSEVLYGIIESLKSSETLYDLSPSRDHLNVLIEYPEQYLNSNVPRKNVQDLAFTAGGLSYFFKSTFSSKVDLILPKEWKGQVPKEIFLDRIKNRLSKKESEILLGKKYSKSIEHNVIDAIGIGLYLIKRM